jgi:hypothetical protein
MTWTPQGFEIQTDQGPRIMAGWVKRPFALDFRAWRDNDYDYERGWLLTHLPTGCQVFGICSDLERAFEIVARVEALGDWGFTDPKDGKPLARLVRALIDELGGEILRGTPSLSPLYRAREAA